MGKYKQKNNQKRQDFLLSFFDSAPHYEEKEVNGFWLVKQINGTTKEPIVAIYTSETFKQYQYLKGIEKPK